MEAYPARVEFRKGYGGADGQGHYAVVEDNHYLRQYNTKIEADADIPVIKVINRYHHVRSIAEALFCNSQGNLDPNTCWEMGEKFVDENIKRYTALEVK